MKALLVKILVFAIVIFCLDYGSGIYLDHAYKLNHKSYAQGHLNYYLDEVQCDTLFVGSSRMLHHVDTRVIGPGSFNLSHAGLHLGYQAGVLHILEAAKKLPSKVLVIDLEIGTIYANQESGLNTQIDYLRYFYPENDFIKEEINRKRPLEFLKYMTSTYRFNGNVAQLIFNPVQGVGRLPMDQGYHPLSKTMDQSLNLDFIDFKDEELEVKDEEFIYYLKSIKALCERNGITLITISSPYYESTLKIEKSSKELSRITKDLGIPYFNYLNKEQLNLDNRAYWYDDAHLNNSGAQILTERLKADLKML